MTSKSPPPCRFRRRWLVGVALLALVSCAGNTTEEQPHAEASVPELPKQALLTSSMRQQPVPGWTITVSQLGLPPGTVVRPVGNIGDRGVFLGITDEGWWLLGLDVTAGQRLFGPVRLGPANDATDFNCYVNRPPMVLCVRQGPDRDVPSTAWVVDTSSGKLTFDGPTDLRVAGTQDQPRLEQIGDYAIAGVTGKGIYGVGLRGELTWFVPGNGILPSQFTRSDHDTTPSTLAVQGSGRVADVVFSVVDGRVVKPSVPQDVQLGQAVVYPGGFGYEYTTAGDLTERVAFFDDTGKKLSEPEPGGKLETRSLDLPIVGSKSNNRIFTLDGRKLLELPPSVPSPDARVIGSRFYISTDADHRVWQQFDLATGEAGKTCEGDSLGFQYIASDGEVAVALGDRTPARGVDLATCETLWSLPGSGPDEAREVWRVHKTLVQRTDDRLFSLVSPR
jgi:hypothetical protein